MRRTYSYSSLHPDKFIFTLIFYFHSNISLCSSTIFLYLQIIFYKIQSIQLLIIYQLNIRIYNYKITMQKNIPNQKQANNSQVKCVDLFYLITTTLFFIGLLVFAIISFNANKLADLSLPRDNNGSVCASSSQNSMMSYLQINGPSINDRKCVQHCENAQPNIWLGGICLSQQAQYLLKQTGEYDKYIQPKINSLNRQKILLVSVATTLGFSIIIFILIQLTSCLFGNGCLSIFTILISFVAAGTTLYFLYFLIPFPIWISFCLVLGLYLLYVIVWKVARRNHQLSSIPAIKNQYISKTLFIRFLLGLLIVVLTFGFTCLIVFQYLSFINQSPYYVWQSPHIFLQVKGLTYKQILVFVQALYFISFLPALYQYLVESLHSNSLSVCHTFYLLFRRHLGSICKLAIVRIIFFVPIFIFTLIKPLQQQKLANTCHCLCGWLLNLARKYSLPIFSYQTAIKQSLNLGQAADRLHYQTHINNLQFNSGYIERISILIIISCVAVGSVLIFEKNLGLSVSLLTLALSIILSITIASPFVSSWIHAEQSVQVRNICEQNRVFQDNI